MLATSPTTSARRGVADLSHYPRDVGIVALDVYFPSTYVSQTDLGTARPHPNLTASFRISLAFVLFFRLHFNFCA
jgi:hypothetical protein